MNKKKLVVFSVFAILILSLSLVSASWFSDFWAKITGKPIVTESDKVAGEETGGQDNGTIINTTNWTKLHGNPPNPPADKLNEADCNIWAAAECQEIYGQRYYENPYYGECLSDWFFTCRSYIQYFVKTIVANESEDNKTIANETETGKKLHGYKPPILPVEKLDKRGCYAWAINQCDNIYGSSAGSTYYYACIADFTDACASYVTSSSIRIENRTESGKIIGKIRYRTTEEKEIEVEIKDEIKFSEDRTAGRYILKARLRNGNLTEINVMPDEASEIALYELGAENPTIELKEKIHNNVPRVVYNVVAKKPGKFLGVFKIAMKVDAQVDAENGDILDTNTPWWGFLVAKRVADEESSGYDKFGNKNITTTMKEYRACCVIGGKRNSYGICNDERSAATPNTPYCDDVKTRCHNNGGVYDQIDRNNYC